MPVSSGLRGLALTLARLALLLASLLFMFFALSPALELLPGGMDTLIAIVFAALFLIWTISSVRRRKGR